MYIFRIQVNKYVVQQYNIYMLSLLIRTRTQFNNHLLFVTKRIFCRKPIFQLQ